jgi:hypothetical protein
MKTVIPKLSDLSDYSSIKKLASALHKFDSNQHGAAIMIGAGFSRSAACHVGGGGKKMPLWNAFSKKLVEQLNPNDKDYSFSDPLRVAEEYRVYFGQAALNDRIRSEIDDDAWRAGPVYKSLLELPWSEIMTTNWDTLLERAAKDVHSPYYTSVTKPSDLTWAPSPRIVKLHGTIGVTESFISAQEDYRTYPAKFAPFVNFARQVFIENELCLLGFSGDDPNFLQWAGWIRDNLAEHARKIYLVGALNLTAARRKYLEANNIAPIDLWDAVKHLDGIDLRHQTATELFLQEMRDEGKSKVDLHEWTLSRMYSAESTQEELSRQIKEPAYAAIALKGQLEVLKRDRKAYPMWLACPPNLRREALSQVKQPILNAKSIAELGGDDRAQLLYEIAWRYGITFEYITPWLVELLFQIVEADEECGLSKCQKMDIALILLKNSRWVVGDDESSALGLKLQAKAIIHILEKNSQYMPDCAAEIAYHRALVARDMLDFAGLEETVGKIEGEDPVWKLRQAALLMELGRFEEGSALVAKTYGELRENYRRDRYSIPVLSRLMWAHWLLESVRTGRFDCVSEELPAFVESVYRKWQCDPWIWIDNIRNKAVDQREEYLKSRNPIEPSFEQGYYRQNSKHNSFSCERSAFFLFEGLSQCIGIPLFSGSSIQEVDLLAGSAEKLVFSVGTKIELRDYILAIRAASSETSPIITGIFTRIGVACVAKEIVTVLVEQILLAIDYWQNKRSKGIQEQQSSALSVLRVLIEVLGRLVVRVSIEKAKEIFRLSLFLGQQEYLQHVWLVDAISSLLNNSLSSIPASAQNELLPEAIVFPLKNEVFGGGISRWPNPILHPSHLRNTYPSLEARIHELIEAVKLSESGARSETLLRFLPLVAVNGFLTENETRNLADALWGSPCNYNTLPKCDGFFAHVFLLLPAPDASRVKALVQCHLYEHGDEILVEAQNDIRSYPSPKINRMAQLYSGISNAAVNPTTRLFPTQDQALKLFDRLMGWRLPDKTDSLLGLVSSEREELIESIGKALSNSIVPTLADEMRTIKRFELLHAFFHDMKEPCSLIPSFVFFVQVNEGIAALIEKIIRKALQSSESDEVSYAALALKKWIEQPNVSKTVLLNNLIARFIVIIESGRTAGLQQLLWVVGEMIRNNNLLENHITALIEAIPNIFNAADYKNIDPNSQEAVRASTIREACVKLASMLVERYPRDHGLVVLLEDAKNDALPEVRFAMDRSVLM